MLEESKTQSAVPFAPPGGDIKRIAAQAKQAAAKNRRRTPLLLVLAVAWLGGTALFFLLLFSGSEWAYRAAFLTMIIYFVTMGYATLVDTDADTRLLKSLVRYSDTEAAGAILECLRNENTFRFAPAPEYKNLRNALVKLLPRLRASDTAQFSYEQRVTLYKMLDGKDTGVVFIVLKALEQIGDADALPYVAKLAAGRGQARRNPALRQAASECLLYLEPIAARSRLGDQLLRPAAPASASDALLRPVLTTTQTSADATQMLRASGE